MKPTLLLAGLAALGLAACATSAPIDAAHNSNNSLDWDGTYAGRIPSASGSGIDTRLTLRTDSTYTLRQRYVGKPGGPFVSTGKFSWDKTGGVIQLNAGKVTTLYRVGENALWQLDREGKPITGSLAALYRLEKQP